MRRCLEFVIQVICLTVFLISASGAQIAYEFSYTASSGPIHSFNFELTSQTFITGGSPSFTPFTITDGTNSWTITQITIATSSNGIGCIVFGTAGATLGPCNAYYVGQGTQPQGIFWLWFAAGLPNSLGTIVPCGFCAPTGEGTGWNGVFETPPWSSAEMINSTTGRFQLTVAAAQKINVTVDGTQGPWVQALNPSYMWGQGDNQPPQAVAVFPGRTVTIQYLSGLVSACAGCQKVDANGELDFPTNHYIGPLDGSWPSTYMTPYPIYLAELVGTFANNGVIVDAPFAIGDGAATFLVPEGANQLLLGVNDNYYPDNSGSFSVSVTPSSQLPPSMPTGIKNTITDVTGLALSSTCSTAITSGRQAINTNTCFSIQQNFWIATPSSPDSGVYWVQNALLIWEDTKGNWYAGQQYFVFLSPNFSDPVACSPQVQGWFGPRCIPDFDVFNADDSWSLGSVPLVLESTLSESSGTETLTLQASVGSTQLAPGYFSGGSGPPLPSGSTILAATTAQEAEQLQIGQEPDLMLLGGPSSTGGAEADFSQKTGGQVSAKFRDLSGAWNSPGSLYTIVHPTEGIPIAYCAAPGETSTGLYWASGNLTNPVAFEDPRGSSTIAGEGVIFVPAIGAGPIAFSQCQCGTSQTGLCTQNLPTVSAGQTSQPAKEPVSRLPQRP